MTDTAGAQAVEDCVTVAPPTDELILEARKLDFFYGKTQSLFGVDLPVARNKITALMGPSGCGKSTLLRVFNRIYDLYRDQHAVGRVLFDGTEVLADPKSIARLRERDGGNLMMTSPSLDPARLRARVGMVFQTPTPFPMSIYDNVAFGVRLYHRRSRTEMDEIVAHALRRAALWEEVKDRLTASALGLSGGQQQRLCVARAIAMEPEVLLLDEPASACDPRSTAKLEETMIELKHQLTIVIVTHNLQQAARISDNTGFMFLGRMIEFSPTADLFSNPRHKQTRAYVTGRFG
jgi:phosphate transport system ATP-binding protein